MTVNIAPPLSGGTGGKVRYASINLAQAPHVPITSDASQAQSQQQKVILQQTNPSGTGSSVPGTVVVSTNKVSNLIEYISAI